MPYGPDEAGQGHEEEEDSNTDYTPYNLEAGDETEPLPPCCDAYHEQTHHLQNRYEELVWLLLLFCKREFSLYVILAVINNISASYECFW